MLAGAEPELVHSGTSYTPGMQIKIEYYWWPMFLGITTILDGYLIAYTSDYDGLPTIFNVERNGKLHHIPKNRVVRMWHYVLPKVDYDLGL